MRVQSKLSLALALGLSAAVSVNAQFLHIGDPDVKLPDMTSGGKPATLEMSPLSDITSYAFDGSDLEIPFVLNGSGATVWLIIYTEGYEAPFTITGEGPGPYQDP